MAITKNILNVKLRFIFVITVQKAQNLQNVRKCGIMSGSFAKNNNKRRVNIYFKTKIITSYKRNGKSYANNNIRVFIDFSDDFYKI